MRSLGVYSWERFDRANTEGPGGSSSRPFVMLLLALGGEDFGIGVPALISIGALVFPF